MVEARWLEARKRRAANRRAARAGDPRSKALDEQATSPKEVRAAVGEAVSLCRGLWISFLSFLAYLMVAVGAVTHRNLFFEDPVRLPLLGVDLPLTGFFVVTPILFVIFHAYLLLHLKLLADDCRRYAGLLRDEVTAGHLSEAARDKLLYQLPNFLFVQLVAAPQESRRSATGVMIRIMAWVTVVFAPVALLLFMQVKFLPYHHEVVTWVHRLAILVDLGLIWMFWPRIAVFESRLQRAIAGATTALVVLVSGLVITFPGERMDQQVVYNVPAWPAKQHPDWARLPPEAQPGDSWTPAGLGDLACLDILFGFVESRLVKTQCYAEESSRQAADRAMVRARYRWKLLGLQEALFAGGVNEVTGERNSWFSNTLVLPGIDTVDDEKLRTVQAREKDLKLAQGEGERFRVLRGRDLRGAVLVRADLRRADLTGANLQGALLNRADLREASLSCAETGRGQSAAETDSDGCTQLQGASLDRARGGSAALRSTFLWRTFGVPDLQQDGAKEQGALVADPRLDPLDADGVEAIEEAALGDVTEEKVKTRILERLQRLRRPDEEATDDLGRTFWAGAEHKSPSEAEHRQGLAATLRVLACNASDAEAVPHVAISLAKRLVFRPSRIAELQGHAAPLARDMLRGKDGDCPGAQGIGERARAELQRIVDEADALAKRLAVPAGR